MSLTFPGVALGVYIYQIEAKHHEHHEHVLEENDGNLPERPPYPYLVRILQRR